MAADERNWTRPLAAAVVLTGLVLAVDALVVPVPYSNPANVDPEEAFVASIASCHMLTFLHVARLAGFQVESYEDDAVGEMAKNERGVAWVAVVTLSPKIVYGGDKQPTHAEEAQLHHKAHDGCFISQSVKTDIKVAGFE